MLAASVGGPPGPGGADGRPWPVAGGGTDEGMATSVGCRGGTTGWSWLDDAATSVGCRGGTDGPATSVGCRGGTDKGMATSVGCRGGIEDRGSAPGSEESSGRRSQAWRSAAAKSRQVA